MEEIEEASIQLKNLFVKQRKILPQKCRDQDATKKDMEQNLQNLYGILRAHVSKYVFIVSQCGGNGSLDTAGQITEGVELLVTSVRILCNKTSDSFGRNLIQIVDSFLNQMEQLVQTLQDEGDSGAITGMVWKHLDDLKAIKVDPLEASLKAFEDMQNRMKDVSQELKELRSNCVLIDSEDATTGGGAEEDVTAASSNLEEDFDALFDDGPEHLTSEDCERVELCISTINFFRRTLLDIYVWLKKGLKYKEDRHDEWLLSLISRRKTFLRNLDMWGAALHEPQDKVEVEQESSRCLDFFEEYVNAAHALNSFSRRKYVTTRKGKKITGTGKEWHIQVSSSISEIRTNIHAFQSESLI